MLLDVVNNYSFILQNCGASPNRKVLLAQGNSLKRCHKTINHRLRTTSASLSLFLDPVPKLDLQIGIVGLCFVLGTARPRNEPAPVIVNRVRARANVELRQGTETNRVAKEKVLGDSSCQ